ncbi:hypothetical protein VC83_04948 [Pseudogymnoascus destructans]|uniref:Uncharacterized protein n=2 Tax=Pseudogymnoascus destructans TaxID=655981 RepID=L8FLJ9_PSED2|nr:uncharacterized protein VC83_04948 [Pseudogymnoascus destructans]ELR01812.1 hypothetical protein GMDG_00912 [Pseudogymnoascus destructans 20631-21]OAF58569.1 hypothetical protein VC83_04948 [Pseudogymnoascus destructans]
MTPRPRMPSLSLRPSLRSRASSHSNMLHARSPASRPPSPGGMERSSYFMTSASASLSSAEMACYGACTSNPWMNSPGSGYSPTSQLPPKDQHQQSTEQQQGQTQSDPPNRSHRPGSRTPTPLSARGGADIGSYFSPWSSECSHTPPLGSCGADGEVKTLEQDGFFAQGTTHTSSTSTSTSTASTAASSAVPQIHLRHRHTHAQNQTRPHLRPPPPQSTVTFPLTMAVAQGKYHPSNYRRNPSPPSTSSEHPSSTATSSPIITRLSPPSASPPTTTQSPLSPPTQAPDTRRLLLQYQRDMVEAAARAAHLSISRSPASPRLGPLGSPGPVTPLELGEGSWGGWLERSCSGDTTSPAGRGGKGGEEEKGEA